MNDKIIDRIKMECPICGKEHLVEIRQRNINVKIKGESVNYEEIYNVCLEYDKEYEFIPSKLMDENLLAARDRYRANHNLLTSKDIAKIRNRYSLSQKDLALLLGWGEVTITRYETKQIQDEAHDSALRKIMDDAMEAAACLERNKAAFSNDKYIQIRAAINKEIENTSIPYLTRKKIIAQYMKFQGNNDATGNTTLDIEKIQNMMYFFANKCANLYKVKLMKLLWYADSLHYKTNGNAMSGLVYQHMPMGALPIANWDIMELVEYEYFVDINGNESYCILPDQTFDEHVFNEKELITLYAVLRKFQNYTGKKIADYMHEESAYTQTSDKMIIPFSLAKEIRPF